MGTVVTPGVNTHSHHVYAHPHHGLRIAGFAACVVALTAAPLVFGDYQLHALIIAMTFLLPALGLNLILGYAGMLSFAQMAFFGIGAYSSALMAMRWGTPFWLNLVVGGVAAGVVAIPLGVPALRLRRYSFVMCTLGFAVIAQTVAKNWISVTRGDLGLSNVPRPRIAFWNGGFQVTGVTAYYYLALIIAVLAVAAFVALVSSAAGRYMIAIREDETLAASVGTPTWHYRMIAFALSAVFAGAGGSFYVHYFTVISPTVFDPFYANTILVIVLGGGVGTVGGVLMGSFLFVAVSEALRIAPDIRMIAFGLLLIVIVFACPEGLVPLLLRKFDGLRARHFKGGTHVA
jgi:branched-chain amino acid transport system permease protein